MKATNTTIHRITAFVLALLLTTTTLSPTITVYAEREGGGHYVEGSGDEDTDRPTVSNHDTTITENENGTRTLNLKQSTMIMYASTQGFLNSVRVEITGSGRFVERSFYWDYENDKETAAYGAASYIFSNKSFELVIYRDDDVFNYESQYYNGIYYYKIFSFSGFCALVNKGEDYKFFYHGFANLIHKTTNKYPTAQDIIDSGTLDLTKDNVTPEDQKADMTPVRDSSIGYLPSCHYYFNTVGDNDRIKTATIQWDSLQERYIDVENPYYIEIYAECNYTLKGEDRVIHNDRYRYRKYGELKYTDERLLFPANQPVKEYIESIGLDFSDFNTSFGFLLLPVTSKLSNYCSISRYYVRLLHYDYDKQQMLCGGWTRLTLDENGGCKSETGDFNPDDDDDWKPDNDSDDSYDDDWGNDGDRVPPVPPSPDEPDFEIDDSNVFTLLFSLVKAASNFIVGTVNSFLGAFKDILSSVGEFPDLCGHVFSFLSDDIRTLMFGGVAAIIIMRFLGR